MRITLSKAAVFAAAGLFGLANMANANHLTAPTNLVCPIVNSVIEADWDDLAGANKYSVNVVATYDTGVLGDATDDTTVDFDFGTGDRLDGFPASQSDLKIALSALIKDFGTGPLAPVDLQLRVKGLHPGRDQGRQNNPFSAFCEPA